MSQRANRKEAVVIVEYDEKRNDHLATDEIAPQKRSIKEEYKDQFDKAIEFVQHQLKQSVSKKEIVKLLNDMGFKTRTGKNWSYAILGIELKKLNSNKERSHG
jgi:hypothetical protein